METVCTGDYFVSRCLHISLCFFGCSTARLNCTLLYGLYYQCDAGDYAGQRFSVCCADACASYGGGMGSDCYSGCYDSCGVCDGDGECACMIRRVDLSDTAHRLDIILCSSSDVVCALAVAVQGAVVETLHPLVWAAIALTQWMQEPFQRPCTPAKISSMECGWEPTYRACAIPMAITAVTTAACQLMRVQSATKLARAVSARPNNRNATWTRNASRLSGMSSPASLTSGARTLYLVSCTPPALQNALPDARWIFWAMQTVTLCATLQSATLTSWTAMARAAALLARSSSWIHTRARPSESTLQKWDSPWSKCVLRVCIR